MSLALCHWIPLFQVCSYPKSGYPLNCPTIALWYYHSLENIQSCVYLSQSWIATPTRKLVLPPFLGGSAIPLWSVMLSLIRARVSTRQLRHRRYVQSLLQLSSVVDCNEDWHVAKQGNIYFQILARPLSSSNPSTHGGTLGTGWKSSGSYLSLLVERL